MLNQDDLWRVKRPGIVAGEPVMTVRVTDHESVEPTKSHLCSDLGKPSFILGLRKCGWHQEFSGVGSLLVDGVSWWRKIEVYPWVQSGGRIIVISSW